MLSKERRIKKRKEFECVFKKGRSFAGSFLIIKTKSNDLYFSRFAFVSPVKFFRKATERSKVKRVMRAVIENNKLLLRSGFDVIVIAQRQIKNKSYKEIEDDMFKSLKKAKLIKIKQ